MLRWKNKPINDLTKEELQQALGEAIYIELSGKNYIYNNDLLYSFATGIVFGTAVSIFGTLLALSL